MVTGWPSPRAPGSIATGTNAVAQSISITTPLAAVPGQRGARFRFTSTQNPGATGASGNAGKTGNSGSDGSKGKTGANGAQGADGADG